MTLSGPAAQASEAAEASVETLSVPEVATALEEAPGKATASDEQEAPAEEGAAYGRDGGRVAPEAADQPEDERVVADLSETRTENYGLVGVTWVAGTAPADLRVQVRTRSDGGWLPWEELDVEDIDSGGEVARDGTEPVWVGDSDGVGVRLTSADAAPAGIQVILIDGGTGLARPADLHLASSDTTTEAEPVPTPSWPVTPKPSMVTRAQWGVDQSNEQPCSSPARSSTLRGITLHHTAGSNGYTQSQAPGIVRATHLYHTGSLGWCDIGYNFLVDRFGTVYVGRRGGVDEQVRGAHAGNYDANLYTSGISMMGDFDTIDVPQATRTAVTDLMAWRLSSFDMDATGKFWIDGRSMDRISGHRDYYLAGVRPATATACPGKYGYAFLNGGLRQAVQDRIDAASTSPTTEAKAPSTSVGRLKVKSIKPWSRGRVFVTVFSPDNPQPVGQVQIRLRRDEILTTRRLFARQDGTGRIALPKLPAGRYRLRAYYRGSPATLPSKSSRFVLEVKR